MSETTCTTCGGPMDYVCGPDGNGGGMHCWSCHDAETASFTAGLPRNTPPDSEGERTMSDTITTQTPRTIEADTLVTDEYGDTFRFGGPSDDSRVGRTVSFSIGGGGHPVIVCDPHLVAPLGVVPELEDLNRKDPRITVANDKAGRPGSWVGPWRADIPGDFNPRWSRTKAEATAQAARRLVIADWWSDAS